MVVQFGNFKKATDRKRAQKVARETEHQALRAAHSAAVLEELRVSTTACVTCGGPCYYNNGPCHTCDAAQEARFVASIAGPQPTWPNVQTQPGDTCRGRFFSSSKKGVVVEVPLDLRSRRVLVAASDYTPCGCCVPLRFKWDGAKVTTLVDCAHVHARALDQQEDAA